jgi:hypothetical protein
MANSLQGPTRPSYAWNGFFQPMDNPPTVNTVKAGSAVPVKFRAPPV